MDIILNNVITENPEHQSIIVNDITFHTTKPKNRCEDKNNFRKLIYELLDQTGKKIKQEKVSYIPQHCQRRFELAFYYKEGIQPF